MPKAPSPSCIAGARFLRLSPRSYPHSLMVSRRQARSAPTSSSTARACQRTLLPCERDHGGMPITLPRRRRLASPPCAACRPGGHRPGIVAVTEAGEDAASRRAGGCGRCRARIMMLPAAAACPVCPPAGSKACARVGRRRDTSNRPASALTKLHCSSIDRVLRACALGLRACVQLRVLCQQKLITGHTEAPAEVQIEHYRTERVQAFQLCKRRCT
jgi:hypothetical protein